MTQFPLIRPAGRKVTAIALAIGSLFFAGSVIVAFNHPITVLGALFLVVAAIAVVRFPIPSLILFLFMEPFHTAIFTALINRAHLAPGPLFYWKDAAIFALFARGLVERLWSDRRFLVREPGDIFLVFYVLAYIALGVASPPRSTVAPAMARYIEGPLLLLSIRFLRPSRKQLWLCAGALLAAAAVIGAAAIYEQLGPHESFLRWYGVSREQTKFNSGSSGYRAGSLLVDPLIVAFYLAAATSFAVAVSAIRTRWRAAALVSVALCTGGLLVTVTRSGYIGGGVGVVVALALAVRNPRFRVALLGLAIVLLGAVSLQNVASGRLIRPDSDAGHREALKRDVGLVEAKPFGYGLGTTDHFSLRPGADPGQLGATESIYMAKTLEGGVQGLVLYLVALFVVGMRVRSVRLRAIRAGDVGGVALAAGGIAVIVAVALSGMFLGIHELVVEVVLWSVPGIALAWPISGRAGTNEFVAGAGHHYSKSLS
jgi:hypothetical protein